MNDYQLDVLIQDFTYFEARTGIKLGDTVRIALVESWADEDDFEDREYRKCLKLAKVEAIDEDGNYFFKIMNICDGRTGLVMFDLIKVEELIKKGILAKN